MFENIEVLTLVSSESCNLNCSYCHIASAVNKTEHYKEAYKVKEALQNGTYYNNIIKVFDRFNMDKEKIKTFQLWGQEPTLTMDAVAQEFPKFYKSFPNIEKVFFSTNSINYAERIAEFAKVIDNTATKPIKLEIQFSYDGMDVVKAQRGIDSDVIINNILKFIELINNVNFKYLHINGYFHNVITVELMKELIKDDQKIIDFYNKSEQICQLIINKIANDRISFTPFFTPGLINPYNATVEEGKVLAQFVNKLLTLKPGNYPESYSLFIDAFPTLGEVLLGTGLTIEDVISYLANFEIEKQDNLNDSILAQLSHPLNCGWGNGELEMRYEGSLIHCHNVIYGLTDEEADRLQKETEIKYQLQASLYRKKYFPNLLTDSEETIKKFCDRSNISIDFSFPQYYVETVNLMMLLSKAGQISEIYKQNPHTLLRHAFICCGYISCWDNSMTETGSGFGRTMGWIRFLCNGYADIIDEIWQKRDGI